MRNTELEGNCMALLLARAGIGDSAAFRDLYLLSASRLLPHAMRIVRKRELAEDVLQESFIAIWRDAARFDCTRAAPLTWMATIVRNKAVDLLRAGRTQAQCTGISGDGEGGHEPCDTAYGPFELAEHAQWRRQIEAGMSGLNALQRRAIELAFFSGLTHWEVALEMTIPLGTAKTHIRRGCATLRRHLARPG